MLHRAKDWIQPDANLCVVAVDSETIAIWKDSRIGETPTRAAGGPVVAFGEPTLEMTTGRADLEGLAVVEGRWLWTVHRDGELVAWDLAALDENTPSTALQKVTVESPEQEAGEGEGTSKEAEQGEAASGEGGSDEGTGEENTELRLPVAMEKDLGFHVCQFEVHREAADTLIALGGETGRVAMLVSRSTNEEDPPEAAIASSRGHSGDVTAIAFGPKMQRIASAGQDDRIMIWSTSTEPAKQEQSQREPEPAEELDEEEVGEETRVVSAELQVDTGGSSSETGGVAPGDTSGSVDESDLPSAEGAEGEKAEEIDTELAEDRPNRLPDDLLDTDIKPPEHDRRLPRLASLSGSQGWPLALAFSPSGDRLVSGAMDNAVYLWDLQSEDPLVGLVNEHHNWVSDVVFSEDGSTVVSASWDGSLGLYDGKDLTPRYRITAHTDYVTGVAFTPGPARQSRLVSIGYDGRVGVWDWKKGKSVTDFQAHADWIEGIRWFEGGEKIRCATVASGGVVRIWGMDGTQIASFGAESAEAFELGREIAFDDVVEVGHLASDEIGPIQQKEARLGEIRAYDNERESDRVQEQTAVSMLESAIQDGEPAAKPAGEQEESDKPDEATALETFEEKLKESGIETPDVENPEAAAKAAEVAGAEQPAGELAPSDQAEPSTPEDATVPDDAPDADEIEAALDQATGKHAAVEKEEGGQSSEESESASAQKTESGDTGSGRDIEQELSNLGGLEKGEKPSIDVDTEDVDISVEPDNPLGRERQTSQSIEEDLETAGATEKISVDQPDIEDDLEAAGATEQVELGGPSLDEDLETAGADKGVDLEGPSLDEDLEHAGASGVESVGAGTGGSAPTQPPEEEVESAGGATPTPGTPQKEPPEDAGPPTEQPEDDEPGKTIVPAQGRESVESDESEGSDGGGVRETQKGTGTAVSPSAMPSTASSQTEVSSDDAEDEAGDQPSGGPQETEPPESDKDDGASEDHEFSDRPKSAEELREGLSKLQEQSGATGQTEASSEEVVDTTARDIWTEQSAREREGMQRTETAPMSELAEAEDGEQDGELQAWKGLSTPLEWIYGVAWQPDGAKLAACGQGGAVYVWSIRGDCLHRLSTSGEELNDVTFTPDGRVVVSGGDDGGLHLWLLPSSDGGDVRHARLSGHDSWINAVATHPNGRWALSGSTDQTARLWNLESGECEAVLEGHGGPVTSVGFTQKHLWTAGRDGLVAQWTTSGERELQWTGYGEIIDLEAHADTVAWVTESGDAHLLAGPERVEDLRSHTRAARGITIDPATDRLATGGADGRIHVYNDGQIDSPAQMMGTDSAIWTLDYKSRRLAVAVESGDLRLFR